MRVWMAREDEDQDTLGIFEEGSPDSNFGRGSPYLEEYFAVMNCSRGYPLKGI